MDKEIEFKIPSKKRPTTRIADTIKLRKRVDKVIQDMADKGLYDLVKKTSFPFTS